MFQRNICFVIWRKIYIIFDCLIWKSFISKNGDTLAFLQHSSLWVLMVLGLSVVILLKLHTCIFCGAVKAQCFSLLTDLAEESPAFNFLLYSCTRVYCFHFRSGSICSASLTQFYNPSREMHVLFHSSHYWMITSGSGELRNHLSQCSRICKWSMKWSSLLLLWASSSAC